MAAAATAATNTAKRVGLAVTGALAAGLGAYYITQAGIVSALQLEQDEMETKVFVAQGKHRRAESNILESESLMKALQQQTELDTKSVESIVQELEAARVKVQQLEAQQQQKEADIERMRLDMARASQQREQALQDVERFKQEAALADKALAALKQQVAVARAQLNPLNHPKLRDFYASR